ncbi:MAG: hypothetical protein ACOYJO_05585 [Eubacterium sp.]|jgi:hypothetical protein
MFRNFFGFFGGVRQPQDLGDNSNIYAEQNINILSDTLGFRDDQIIF